MKHRTWASKILSGAVAVLLGGAAGLGLAGCSGEQPVGVGEWAAGGELCISWTSDDWDYCNTSQARYDCYDSGDDPYFLSADRNDGVCACAVGGHAGDDGRCSDLM